MDAPTSKNIPNPEWHELFKEENESYSLSLYAGNSHMECWAYAEVYPAFYPQSAQDDAADEEYKVAPSEDGLEEHSRAQSLDRCEADDLSSAPTLNPHELIAILHKLGITDTIDRAALYEFCALMANGVDPPPTVIARGVPAQKGPDGWLDLKVKVSGSDIELCEDVKGYIDYKNLNRFSEIQPGQKLAIVRSPGRGIPGMSIQGFPIVAENGNPYALTAGEGVELKYAQRVAFATKAGKAMLEGNTLKVVDHLKINGDVDLTIGDIDFNGVVEITGEVPDGFDVKASSGLYIYGSVGACQIESGGELEIKSMFGKDIGTIICRGTLKARYLNQVNVYCYGDVIVDKEIRNSRVKSTGCVRVERGSIIGGLCVALAGIEAQNIGAPSAVTTKVAAGVYFPDEDRFAYLLQRREQIRQQLKSINEAIDPLKRLIRNKPALAATAEKRLDILEAQLVKLSEDKIRTRSELQSSTRQQPEGRNPKINVHKRLYEGAEIKLGEILKTILHEYSGSFSVIEDPMGNDLLYVSLTDLAIPAPALSGVLPEV